MTMVEWMGTRPRWQSTITRFSWRGVPGAGIGSSLHMPADV